MAEALALKEKGNLAYAKSLLDEAESHYRAALALLEGSDDPLQQRFVLYSNLAAVMLARKDWQKALECADASLRANPKAKKSWERRATALEKLAEEARQRAAECDSGGSSSSSSASGGGSSSSSASGGGSGTGSASWVEATADLAARTGKIGAVLVVGTPTGTPSATCVRQIYVDPSHPAFTQGARSPVCHKVGFPIRVWRTGKSETGNQIATFLMVETGSGFAPMEWQGGAFGYIGDVVVVHTAAKTGKPADISPAHVWAVHAYLDQLMDAFGDGDRDRIDDMMTPPTFRAICASERCSKLAETDFQ